MRLRHLLAAAALLAPCVALHADTLDYTFTATSSTNCAFDPHCTLGQILEFQVSSHPTITSYTADSFSTVDFKVIQNTTGDGASNPYPPGSYEQEYLVFGVNGFEFLFYPLGSYTGIGAATPTPFFTGPTSAPTLLTGSIPVSLNADYASQTLGGPLVITDIGPISATPEPSSLILLGTGLIGIVAAARRRLL